MFTSLTANTEVTAPYFGKYSGYRCLITWIADRPLIKQSTFHVSSQSPTGLPVESDLTIKHNAIVLLNLETIPNIKTSKQDIQTHPYGSSQHHTRLCLYVKKDMSMHWLLPED